MDHILEELIEDRADGKPMDAEDEILAPLLAEIELIEDQGVHSFVRSLLTKANPNFWTDPAIFVGGKEYPPDEHAPGGNVLHTKRVFRVVYQMSIAQQRSEDERDILLAAALLHGVTKGVEREGGVEFDPLHPYTVDAFVKWAQMQDEKYSSETTSSTLWLDDIVVKAILRIVRCQRGYWSAIPETVPMTGLDWSLHIADLIVSRIHHIIDGNDVKPERWLLEEE